jgi:hypothetical protein
MEKNPAVDGGTMRKMDPVGKLFSDTWQFYKAHFDRLGKIILIPAAIVAVGGVMVAYRGPDALTFLGGLISIIGGITFIFGGIALLFAVIKGTDVAESYRLSKGMFWPLVWVSILGGVIALGGVIMLIIPGIMMGMWFLLSRYLVIAEDRRGLNALTQSREYARGYWWALFGRTLLMGIAVGIASAIVSGILGSIVKSVGAAFIGPVITMFVWVFVVPYSIVYIYMIYKNMAALKPELATMQSNASRGFLKASGIVGIVGIILIPIFIVAIIGFLLLHGRVTVNGSPDVNTPPGVFGSASSTTPGTPSY